MNKLKSSGNSLIYEPQGGRDAEAVLTVRHNKSPILYCPVNIVTSNQYRPRL